MRLKIVAAVSFVLSLVVVYTCAIPNVEATKQPSFKLAEGAPIKVGPMAGQAVIADGNHDGNLDIILACGTCCGSQPSPESGHVQVLLGDGRGQFTRAKGTPIPICPSARKVAVGDGNGDGLLDVFVAQHDSYEVVMLAGNGKGEFTPAPDSPFIAAKGTRPHTHDITTGDVNGDGQLDLLTTNANDNTISILLGDGKGKFAPAPNSPLSAGRHPYDVVRLADVNNDSKVVVLDFMASWCGKCVETLPHLKALKERFGPQDLEIISVSLDGGETTDTTINDLNHLLTAQKVNWPVVFDDTGWDNTVARNYGVNALPFHVVIDRQGIIRAVSNGAEKAELMKLNQSIAQLIEKRK